jgi:hypothetical protein
MSVNYYSMADDLSRYNIHLIETFKDNEVNKCEIIMKELNNKIKSNNFIIDYIIKNKTHYLYIYRNTYYDIICFKIRIFYNYCLDLLG